MRLPPFPLALACGALSILPAAERDENGFTEEDRQWWAIQPLTKAEPPAAGADWAKNEFDHFIARKLE